MSAPPTRAAVIGAAAAAAFLLLSGCSTGSADSTTTVTGTDDTCVIASDELEAGRIDFEFTNTGDEVSELYVLRENGDVVSEVENVTTGTSRTLAVDLAAGEYQVRCVPGQTGEGFSTDFTVTGEGGAAQATADREISFDAVDFTYENLDVSDIVTGETIRFEMDNKGEQPHEFEVLDPDGRAVGEIAEIAASFSGGATMGFEAPGVYTYQCILVDPESGKEHTELGMIGTFEVPES
jgi:iron uptake system component EfeO